MLSGWYFGVWQAPPEPDWGQADGDDDEDEDQKEKKKAVVVQAAEAPQQQSMMEKRFGNRAVKEVSSS